MHANSPWDPDLIDALQQPIWTLYNDGTVAYANSFWRGYTGLGEQEATGHGWATAVHPDDVRAIEERWDAASQAREPYEIEYRFRRADGTYRWHLARVAPLPTSEATSPSWVGIAIDIDDRRHARDELRSSEARYRDVVAYADDIIYTARLDSTIVTVNPAVERILGYHPDELVGTSLDALVAPDHLELSHSQLVRKLDGDDNSTYEADVISKSGHRVTLEINTRLVKTDGQPTLIHGIARDISSRRQRARQAELGAAIGTALTAQRALPDQLQACTDVLVEHLDAALARIWIVDELDPTTLVLRASAGLYTYLDGPYSRIAIGNLKVGRIAAEQRPYLSNSVTDDPEIQDQKWARREGMVSFAGYPLLIGTRLIGVVAVFSRHALSASTQPTLRSIADAIAIAIDRDRAERSLATLLAREREVRVRAQIAETRYRALFEGVADAILVADRSRQYQDANPAAIALLGYSRDELLQLRVDDIVTREPDWTQAEYDRFATEGVWQGELELRRKDGKIVPVEARATIVQLSTGPLYLSAVRDISDRAQLARLQRDFLAMVTHDVRTPLTSIKGRLQLLLRHTNLDERARLHVRSALEQVEKTGFLINDLADLIRIEASELQLNQIRVDLLALVREEVALMQEQTQHHVLRIDAPEQPITGVWDRHRVAQIVQNLLTNAVKYSPAGGHITVRLFASGNEAHIQVVDQGIGILPDRIPLLFERFYRAGVTGAGGLGLGLHITRLLVEAHGGHIDVESIPGDGSTFTVTLPLTPPSTEP